ncbi:NIC-domain-containing protein [Rhizoclosmatium globosum]|uniref:Nuclear pore protein n=1 Tax=Rhizoclosmatium globosum TaxID=329046 RepID=A0A1Y2D1W4_9FUNG|nr:NIC-domain-containing protein [Rhizoclosmatium globosum]|eukprot:ORY53279.1 NIC-domain-containing protein [Rhizoclosmatium globosum]
MTSQLDFLFAQSSKLTSHIVSESEVSNSATNAAFLLAAKGFDAEKAAAQIGALLDVTASASSGPTSTTQGALSTRDNVVSLADAQDLDAFLLKELQAASASAIDNARRAALRDCRRRQDKLLVQDWQARKKRLFGELSSSAQTSNATPFKLHKSFSSTTPAQPSHSTPSSSSASSGNAAAGSFNPFSSTSNSTSTPAAAISLQMLNKHKAYAQAVSTLIHSPNSSIQDPFALFTEVSQRLERVNTAPHSQAPSQLSKCWQLLSYMFGSESVNGIVSDDVGSIYQLVGGVNGPALEDGDEVVALRRRIVDGGRTFLQTLYYTYIQHLLHASRAEIGGLPTPHTYISTYIRMKYTKNASWIASANLEVHGGEATWAHLFYLVRCGLGTEGIEYVEKKEAYVGAKFSLWYRQFLSEGRLVEKARAEVLEDWNQNIRPLLDAAGGAGAGAGVGSKVDPFKVALYKIMGRCDMARKALPQSVAEVVAPSVEDYLWIQLMLVSEELKAERSTTAYAGDKYGLKDMQNNAKIRSNTFNKSPHVYFLVLLLCGEFERAVAFLYTSTPTDLISGGPNLDAIHFAIALASKNLLRVPENPRGLRFGVLLFGKVVYHYAKLFFRSDPADAVCYLAVLGNYAGEVRDGEMEDVVAGSERDYAKLLDGYLKELVVESVSGGKSVGVLLGESVSGRDVRVAGEIEKLGRVLKIGGGFEELCKRVFIPAAKELEAKGRVGDAVKVYDAAQEWDVVVGVLSKLVGEAFVAGVAAAGSGGAVGGLAGLYGVAASTGKPSASTLTGQGVSLFGSATPTKSTQQQPSQPTVIPVVAQATQTWETYTRRGPSILSAISPQNQNALTTLLNLHKFLALSSGSAHAAEALDFLKANIKLVPTPGTSDMPALVRLAQEFNGLPAVLAKCTCVKVYQAQPVRRDECKKWGRAVLVYAGNIQYRIPSDVFAKLNRLEVGMN